MKNISTIAILIGSANVSLLFTIFYNYNQYPPICYLILSICFLFLMLLTQYQFRHFKLLESNSATETIALFNKYLYLFFVGVIVVIIKVIMYMRNVDLELHYQNYMFVACFQIQNNLYFNMSYYLGNYVFGKYYIKMFQALHNKFINKELQGTSLATQMKLQGCRICLSDIQTGTLNTVTKCGHSFHMICLRKWLQLKNICPLCKTSVLPEISIEDNI